MTVFVTGASAGFGAAITKKFVTEGHRVVASGRRQERLKELTSELATDRLHTFVLDVRDRPAVEHAISVLPAEFAEIDVVVNNAGLALGLEPDDLRVVFAARFDKGTAVGAAVSSFCSDAKSRRASSS